MPSLFLEETNCMQSGGAPGTPEAWVLSWYKRAALSTKRYRLFFFKFFYFQNPVYLHFDFFFQKIFAINVNRTSPFLEKVLAEKLFNSTAYKKLSPEISSQMITGPNFIASMLIA